MNITQEHVGIIILAAGKGTRMKSDRAKVLHEICGRSMISHVVQTAEKIAGKNIIVVVGHQGNAVKQDIIPHYTVSFADQNEQLGTGHAVMCALPHVDTNLQHIIILCGDVPLISDTTIKNLIENHLKNDLDISLLAVDMENPTGYGRILTDNNNHVTGIVEEADATLDQKNIKTINSGIYCVGRQCLSELLAEIKPNNKQGEYYLTDIISIGVERNKKIGLTRSDNYREIIGINDVKTLEHVEALMNAQAGKIS